MTSSFITHNTSAAGHEMKIQIRSTGALAVAFCAGALIFSSRSNARGDTAPTALGRQGAQSLRSFNTSKASDRAAPAILAGDFVEAPASAIGNLEKGVFDGGRVWDVVRFDLNLSDEPPVKACARRHVDEAGRETYWFFGKTADARSVQGIILRKQSWDFSTTKEEVTDVSISLLGKIPMRVSGSDALAYWFAFGVKSNELVNRTFGGVDAPLDFMQKTIAEFQGYSPYWFATGIRFKFAGNEPEWVVSAEPKGFHARLMVQGFDQCVASLSALISSDTQKHEGPTSPFK
ncbi:hypothetical protein ASG19_04380 [Rhizobium sp. Leaf306]|uniref:hypothetical protein n=1 Tax=Rhizobium sp. Leaf306 TaxID=1736330 RepID=UPI000712BFD7|nr:hypothetical protein [Rhizobium sp. Leaf306]KQQ38298.1 hypothetical protein ASG19_04380 [Rhizobium sp. Leaf306]